MDKIYETLNKYLNTPNPPPHLAILIETPSLGELLLRMGFTQQGEYYIIAKADAEALVLPQQPKRIDWATHWKKERERQWD